MAMNSYNSMTETANNMQKTYEKLSSVYRINGAAVLSIFEKMRGQIDGLIADEKSIQDGLSLV